MVITAAKRTREPYLLNFTPGAQSAGLNKSDSAKGLI